MTAADYSAGDYNSTDDGNNNTASLSSTTIDHHYGSHTASTYESAFFYSPGEYNDWLCATVKSVLLSESSSSSSSSIIASSNHDDTALANHDDTSAMQQQRRRRRQVLIDVGGGTGNFTRALLTSMNDDNDDEQWEAIVVDPYLQPNNDDADDEADCGVESSSKTTSMDTAPTKNNRIRFVMASAQDFIQTTITTREEEEEKVDDSKIQNSGNNNDNDALFWKSGYDCVLLKEVIHHIDPIERVAIFTGLKNGFFVSSPSSSGTSDRNKLTSLLIITRPKHDIDYPLWPKAYHIWSKNQPCTQQIVSDLQLAGYSNIAVQIYTYTCTVRIGQWLRMIKNRFWSTFATFTNEELHFGCEYIVKEAQSKSSAAENGQSSSSSVTIENNNFVLQFEERLVFITASVV